MANYSLGKVLLIKFPFTDSARIKKRPALVILDTGDKDELVARITTKIYSTIFDKYINYWDKAGLLKPSVVRLHKMATLTKNDIDKSLGQLNKDDLNVVCNKLKEMFC